MGTRSVSYTLEVDLQQITIDIVTSRVVLQTTTKIVETGQQVGGGQEDVTDLMSQPQKDAAVLLAAAAKAYVASKVP